MKKNKKDLWLALDAYHFGHVVPEHLWDKVVEIFGGVDASTKAFAEKIARKLNWEKDFALVAISEYKKFVYLAVVSEFSVTPSKIIDQVWHEHVLFTAGYRKFCSEVIDFQLDHNPELLQMESEMGIFGAQYEKTLELYRNEFNIDPPESIWGKTKFKKDQVDLSQYEPKKKKPEDSNSSPDSSDNTVLWIMMNDSGSVHHNSVDFGGGHFGGGGADGSFDNNSNDSHSDSGHDSTPADTGHSSCSSSSCSSSSCSSSCGGGGD